MINRKALSKFIKESRMDARVRTLIEATISMDAAIKLYGKANDIKVITKHFNKVRNEAINAGRAAGITDRELKIIGLITKGAGNLPRLRMKEGRTNRSTSLFAYTWNGVIMHDIKKIVSDNKLKTKRARDKTGDFIYGFSGKQLVFKYDTEDLELYTDYTLIDFMNKKFA